MLPRYCCCYPAQTVSLGRLQKLRRRLMLPAAQHSASQQAGHCAKTSCEQEASATWSADSVRASKPCRADLLEHALVQLLQQSGHNLPCLLQGGAVVAGAVQGAICQHRQVCRLQLPQQVRPDGCAAHERCQPVSRLQHERKQRLRSPAGSVTDGRLLGGVWLREVLRGSGTDHRSEGEPVSESLVLLLVLGLRAACITAGL